MTEDEARKRWCPFARVSSPIYDLTKTWGGSYQQIGAETTNRPAEISPCIGSACMAWSWIKPPILDPFPTPTEDADNAGDGDCGLIRRPVE